MAETDWRKIITDPIEKRIFDALADSTWEWRTLDTLARIARLGKEETRQLLERYPTLVRRSLTGDDLYTLQERYFARKDPITTFWDIASSSST